MQRQLAEKIADVFENAVGHEFDGYSIEQVAERHKYVESLGQGNWLNLGDREPYRLGVFKFEKNGKKLYILITIWLTDANVKIKDNYYLVIFRKMTQRAVAEIWEVAGNRFHWKYPPRKRDGRNVIRKDLFGNPDVYFTIPDSDKKLTSFLDDIFSCIERREYADSLPEEATQKTDLNDYDEIEEAEISKHAGSLDIDFSDVEERAGRPEEKTGLVLEPRREIPKRNGKYADYALVKANYKCEYNPEDRVFKRENGTDYTETHHLIPLSKYDDFKNSIDVVENIVSLCSHCHNLLHYGRFEDKKLILDKLFNDRRTALASKGIVLKSVEDLYKYYR